MPAVPTDPEIVPLPAAVPVDVRVCGAAVEWLPPWCVELVALGRVPAVDPAVSFLGTPPPVPVPVLSVAAPVDEWLRPACVLLLAGGVVDAGAVPVPVAELLLADEAVDPAVWDCVGTVWLVFALLPVPVPVAVVRLAAECPVAVCSPVLPAVAVITG